MTPTRRLRILEHPLVAAVVFTGVGVLPLFLVSAQILQIGRDLDFGVGQLAIATATYTGFSAAVAGLSGGPVSTLGPTTGLRAGAATTIVASLLAASAPLAWMIPLATAVAGAGNGLTQVAANVAIFDGVRSERQGVAYGAKQSAVPMASVLAGLSLPLIGLVVGWRWAFVLAAALAALLLTSVPRLDRERAQSRAERDQGRIPWPMIPLAVGGLSGAMAGNGVALFVVPSAVDVGISEALAGGVLAVCSILVVAVRIGAGWVADKRNSTGHGEMIGLTILGAAASGLLVLAGEPVTYLLAIPIALLGTWGWPGVFFFTVVHSFPGIPARASALVLAGNFVGTLIGPVVVGIFASRGDYERAWVFVAATALVSAIGFTAARLTSPRERLPSV